MPPVPSLGFLCPEQAVHGGRAHLEKSSRERIRKSGPMSCHGSQEFRQGCLQPLATELPGKVIHPDEPFYHGRTVHMLPLSGPGGGSRGEAPLRSAPHIGLTCSGALDQRARGDQGHCSQDHSLCVRTQ